MRSRNSRAGEPGPQVLIRRSLRNAQYLWRTGLPRPETFDERRAGPAGGAPETYMSAATVPRGNCRTAGAIAPTGYVQIPAWSARRSGTWTWRRSRTTPTPIPPAPVTTPAGAIEIGHPRAPHVDGVLRSSGEASPAGEAHRAARSSAHPPRRSADRRRVTAPDRQRGKVTASRTQPEWCPILDRYRQSPPTCCVPT
jgi:hypothetical protein